MTLSKKQIQDSPPIEAHKPVTRQYEIDYLNYYGWPAYWESGPVGGIPVSIAPIIDGLSAAIAKPPPVDKHLQSTHDITGYKIQTAMGEPGRVSSFLIDDRT